jgi:MFS transporter, DHA2 family, multidrug resistance protein
LSQYIQFVQGVDAFGVGLRFLPLAAGALISSNLAARLTALFGLRTIVLTGMVLVMSGLTIFATITTASGFLPVALAFGALGCGMGLVVAPASNAIMSSLPPSKVGAGAGLRSTVQLLGGSFGVAIIGSLAVSRYRVEIEQALAGPLQNVPAGSRGAIMSQIGDARVAASHLAPSVAHSVVVQTNEAFVSGMRLSATVSVALLAVATVAAALWIPKQRTPAHEVEPSGFSI